MNRLPACAISAWSACFEGGASFGPDSAPPLRPASFRPPSNRAVELLQKALLPIQSTLCERLRRYEPSRVGVFLGSSTGGIERTERFYLDKNADGKIPETYSFEMSHSHYSLIEEMNQDLGVKGPSYVVSTACSSSAKAIAVGQRWLALGLIDAAIVGGADSRSELTRLGFSGLNLIDPIACRPFDAERRGLVLGEGAALLLLERSEDSGPSRVFLRAVGESNDAYDLTAPEPEGRGAELAMRRALEIGGLSPADIDYINAHGTATKQNDLAETKAIARVFPFVPSFSSTKSTTAHLLGTAGALEAVLCTQALTDQHAPPNRVPTTVDTSLACQPDTSPEPKPLRFVLSNSFAFGGSNASVLLGREPDPEAPKLPARRLYLTNASFSIGTPDKSESSILPSRLQGRSSPLIRTVAYLFQQLALAEDKDTPALILGSAFGELQTTLALLTQLKEQGTVSPIRFSSSVHNASIGLLTQLTGNRGYATALAAGASTVAMALAEAMVFLRCHGGSALVLCADEEGPTTLLSGDTFPACGVGFRIVASGDPPEGAWAELEELRPAAVAQSPQVPHELAQLTKPEEGPLQVAPAAFGLCLAHALLKGGSPAAESAIGPGHVLALKALA